MERQILDDVLILALHGRRQMEQNDLRSATMESDPIWPASQVVVAQETNLWKLFSSIVHAKEIKVIWEKADHLFGDNPYTGRIPQFAGSIEISVESKESKTINVSIGSMAASYVASVMNRRGE